MIFTKKGYAMDDEELIIGVRCLAVPIFNDNTTDEIAIKLIETSIQLSCFMAYKNTK